MILLNLLKSIWSPKVTVFLTNKSSSRLNTCRRFVASIFRSLRVVLLLSACAIATGCQSNNTSNFTPISDPKQRIEFEGFSILPPMAKGWMRLPKMEQPLQAGPNYTVRLYLIKYLMGEAKSAVDLHRLTVVVRTYSLEDRQIENTKDTLLKKEGEAVDKGCIERLECYKANKPWREKQDK